MDLGRWTEGERLAVAGGVLGGVEGWRRGGSHEVPAWAGCEALSIQPVGK